MYINRKDAHGKFIEIKNTFKADVQLWLLKDRF